MKTINEIVKVNHDGTPLHLYYSYPEDYNKPLPVILIFHTWAGQDLFCHHKANLVAQKGYLGVVVDLYGEGRQGDGPDECSALMMPLINDRGFLRDRIKVIMEHLQWDKRVDKHNIVAQGYCFGGLCVLDAVRNNVGLKAGISIHGLFSRPDYELPHHYDAKFLALYGYKDPLINQRELRDLEHELQAACDDWQLIVFGQGMHAFTNPQAFDEERGLVYHALLDKRTTKYVDLFIKELFA